MVFLAPPARRKAPGGPVVLGPYPPFGRAAPVAGAFASMPGGPPAYYLAPQPVAVQNPLAGARPGCEPRVLTPLAPGSPPPPRSVARPAAPPVMARRPRGRLLLIPSHRKTSHRKNAALRRPGSSSDASRRGPDRPRTSRGDAAAASRRVRRTEVLERPRRALFSARRTRPRGISARQPRRCRDSPLGISGVAAGDDAARGSRRLDAPRDRPAERGRAIVPPKRRCRSTRRTARRRRRRRRP